MENVEMPGTAGGNPREQVSIPAIFLMIVGGFTIVVALWGVIQSLSGGNAAQMEELLNNPQIPAEFKSLLGPMGKMGIFTSLFQLILGGFTLFGALKMKNLESYPLAIAASVIALIPCFGSCCCTGIPIGIWSLIVLTKPEVKSSFRRS
ncbi:hypothetical protein [Hyalangium sp.]|uniref:hypothetical protein n=1 Tax=Hyalangium sp. TaxID=2028555 RepID=UPI002D354A16|nr:hypothetical protein [Hyalangium sp.]HYI02700.1 hypothetical protein [Hyalangium sp.]